jgi:protein-S-isoprenylcysteine O-methyltransferase Ste14
MTDVIHAPARAAGSRAGIALYGLLFAVALPSLLLAWMWRIDAVLGLPPIQSRHIGWALLMVAVALVTGGVVSLWRHGGGLPMSPFPPPRLATHGAYAVVAHPIYAGSALGCAGVALALGSTGGLVVVTPVFAAAMTAFVVGYERDSTRARFGRGPSPWLRMPAGTAGRWVVFGLWVLGLRAAWLIAAPSASALDPVALVVVVAAAAARWRIWRALCRATEAVANSWREWRVGPVRFMSHGIYAGLGAAAGVAVASWLAGPGAAPWLIGLALAAEVGAAAWAQVVEGSSQLLRPYGYFGSVVAVIVATPLAWLGGADPWLLLGAFSVGACVTQVFGRLRCLVQGCCHGRRVDADWGICYRHPRSRVLRLSDLGHLPVHPTQLYAILSSLAAGAALVRLWTLAVPLSFICGAYLVLMGLTRFVEEHYRGEPQTAWVGGLRLYQWLAVAFVVCGAAVTGIGGRPAPQTPSLPPVTWPWLAALALVTYAAYGVDFPRSSRRFSRLV